MELVFGMNGFGEKERGRGVEGSYGFWDSKKVLLRGMSAD